MLLTRLSNFLVVVVVVLVAVAVAAAVNVLVAIDFGISVGGGMYKEKVEILLKFMHLFGPILVLFSLFFGHFFRHLVGILLTK